MSHEENKNTVLDEDKKAISDMAHEFYQNVPYPEVEAFDLKAASDEEVAAFKGKIDAAQAIIENMEGMRLRLHETFTPGELEDMDFRVLQRIAKQNEISAKQSKAALVADMTGMNKSVRPSIQLRECFGRLGWARNKAQYPHPRQTAARQPQQS